ncbi:MerR family transcriptional regulator [Streptomyces sp. NPDC056730]|uniref:MerR family transcriptional regulator n=1 Tax=Streptomyces sp. NPDC056730 TaxID=3345929 RepID=UPI00368EC172
MRAIRHYHEVGLLAEPERRANGYKSHGVAHLIRVSRIKRLTDLPPRLGRAVADADISATERSLAVVPAQVLPRPRRRRDGGGRGPGGVGSRDAEHRARGPVPGGCRLARSGVLDTRRPARLPDPGRGGGGGRGVNPGGAKTRAAPPRPGDPNPGGGGGRGGGG